MCLEWSAQGDIPAVGGSGGSHDTVPDSTSSDSAQTANYKLPASFIIITTMLNIPRA